jgi:hypothetical protein
MISWDRGYLRRCTSWRSSVTLWQSKRADVSRRAAPDVAGPPDEGWWAETLDPPNPLPTLPLSPPRAEWKGHLESRSRHGVSRDCPSTWLRGWKSGGVTPLDFRFWKFESRADTRGNIKQGKSPIVAFPKLPQAMLCEHQLPFWFLTLAGGYNPFLNTHPTPIRRSIESLSFIHYYRSPAQSTKNC